jgi:histidyl-tRNA synthetase
MKNFGMKDEDFEILVSTVAVANALDGFFGKEKSKELARVADKKNKVTGQEFRSLISSIIGDESDAYIQALESATVKEFLENIPPELAQSNEMQEGCSAVKEVLKNTLSINVRFAPYIRRGFDYYTGTLFEVFDKNPENNRSIFGGGRYDDLLAIFGAERVPAVGFGMGDVMIREVLETYGLLKGRVPQTKTDVYICVLDDAFNSAANTLAADLREQGLNVAIDYTGKKVGDQIKKANKDGIRYALCIGEEEVASSKYKIKDLVTGAEKVATKDTIVTMVKV